MKFWVDVLTPKQVLFFQPLVRELHSRGHEVLATTREYREVKGLAGILKFDLVSVGRHGGGSLGEKLLSSAERTLELARAVSGFSPNAAISFSSPECARVSFGFNVPHVCVNDSPHSEKVAKLTVPLSDLLLTPWIVPYAAWTRFGIPRRRILRYRAIDPVAWLKKSQRAMGEGSERKGEREGKGERKWLGMNAGLEDKVKTLVFRLVESQASYSSGFREEDAVKLLEQLASSRGLNLVVLCRYKEQLEKFKNSFGSRLTIPGDVVFGKDLLAKADVFVGMGGTMSWEAALMGIPTVSMRRGPKLYVEKYMMRKGLVVRATSARDAIKAISRLLQDRVKRAWEERAKSALDGMEDPIPLIASAAERVTRH